MNKDGLFTEKNDGVFRPPQPLILPRARPVVARDLSDALKKRYTADKTSGGLELPLALHHVIPWRNLWRFWNQIIRTHHYQSAQDMLILVGLAPPEAQSVVHQMSLNSYDDSANCYD